MRLPSWVSWPDLAVHAGHGALITLGAALSHSTALYAVSMSLFCGLLREYSEVTPDGRPWSDARAEHGGPANAIVDVLAWLPASLLYAVLR